MRRSSILFASLALLSSCSTVRSLSEGEYRLVENKIVYTAPTELKPSDVSPYVKQQAFKWSPGLNIYNWADPKSDRKIDNFWRKVGTPPVIFDKSLVGSSVENIEGRLQNLGYYGSTVTASVDTLKRRVKVTFSVTPGKRYEIDSVVYQIPSGEFSDEFLADSANITVGPGTYLSETALEAESQRSAGYFRNLGYYDFSKSNYVFEADTLGSRNILYYKIRGYGRNEGEADFRPIEKYTFGDVSIIHSENVKFNEKPLRDLNLLKPGSTYSEKDVNNNYIRYSSLNVFSSVGIELTPQEDRTLDCTINLHDSNPQGFKFNLEASSNSTGLIGISPKVSYYHKNIFHGGQRLTVDFSGAFQFQPNSDIRSTEVSTTVGLSFPRFLGIPTWRMKTPNIPRTDITATYSYQDRPEYRRRVSAVSYGYTGQNGKRFFYQILPVRINYVYLFGISEDFLNTLMKDPELLAAFDDNFNAGMSASFYYTTNNDLVPKTPYHYVRLNVDLAGNLISLFNNILPVNEYGERTIFNSPYSQFVRGEITLGRTFRWGDSDRHALALRLLGGAGYAYGNSYALPFDNAFFTGGANSMRGWQARSLGPGFSEMNPEFKIPSQYGDFKLEFDAEYRADLFWKIEGALFAEAGNIWTYGYTQDFLRSIALDWGFGVRLDLDVILVRLDCGIKLYEPSRSKAERWRAPNTWFKNGGFTIHLGVGYPF